MQYIWSLETKQLLAQIQAAYKQRRSTEAQTTYLAQEIEDAFVYQCVDRWSSS